ncbi:DUF3592 domain-containing protein [Haloarchaeobius amylolyticus]|uniref:DUF3592 domain-containing protein n=1 Tax=Haloarchaeobius amylolyticus TaxID=1198296 RepID=UPI00226D7D03|nr:DUF3592 domain-containing protein [Haloarchaeobius amylolyticus]
MSDRTSLSVDTPDSFRGAVLLLLVGLAVTGFGAYDYVQQGQALENAVTVEAEVTEVDVETSSGGKSAGVDYVPAATFTYTYEGTNYTSDEVFPSESTPNYDTESAARDVLDGYETGDTVTAYVPPGDPGDAFLKDQKSNSPLLFTGIGLFFVLIGGWSTVQNYGP